MRKVEEIDERFLSTAIQLLLPSPQPPTTLPRFLQFIEACNKVYLCVQEIFYKKEVKIRHY